MAPSSGARLAGHEKLATPLFPSTGRWRGPGHGCVAAGPEGDLFVYHASDGDAVFGRHPRIPLVARVRWHDGWSKLTPLDER